MNLYDELTRATAPAMVTGNVKVLTREEIAALESAGGITPVKEIRLNKWLPRVHYPADWGTFQVGFMVMNFIVSAVPDCRSAGAPLS